MSAVLRWTHILALGAVLFGLWLVLSGHYTSFLLMVGAASTFFAVYIAVRMDLVDHEGVPVIHLTARLWTYIPWLLKEIVLSNIAAVRIILSPDLPIKPMMLRVRSRQRTDLGRVIFANSITLTPGTVTVAVVGDTLFVHALDGESAGNMDDSEMNRRVAGLERELVVR
ncbi:MAG: Na+/H+ antiporter subunit E [Gemmatimonadota bacterium]